MFNNKVYINAVFEKNGKAYMDILEMTEDGDLLATLRWPDIKRAWIARNKRQAEKNLKLYNMSLRANGMYWRFHDWH